MGASGNSYRGAKERRAQLLDLLRGGMMLGEAIEAVGWKNRRSYHNNRHEYPEWAKEVDLAKTAGRAFQTPKVVRKRQPVVKIKAGEYKRAQFLEDLKNGADYNETIAKYWTNRGSYWSARSNYRDWAVLVDRAKGGAPTAAPSIREYVPIDDGVTRIHDTGDMTGEFQAFVAKYFPDRRPHQPQQLELIKRLHELQPREICLFLCPPESGKTSSLEDYVCKTLAEDPNHRFRIVSEGEDLAKRIVGTCVRRFTDVGQYPEFIARYGPFYEKGQERKGRPWTTNQITVLKNSGGERDRSLVANGISSAAYGSRIDTLIIDDVQSQRNINASEDILRTLRKTFFNRGKLMRTLIVGTRISGDDLYSRLLEAQLPTRQYILAAANAQGNPTVPEFWDEQIFHGKPGEPTGPCCSGFRECPRNGEKLTPREFMELTKFQAGEETWWAAYMQRPQAEERSTFAAFLDKCYDHDRSVGERFASASVG